MSHKVLFALEGNIHIEVPSDSPFLKEFLFRPDKEWGLRLLVKTLYKEGICDPKKSIFDAGAWLGDNALPWAKMITGPVVAVDPSEVNCKFMADCGKLNSLQNLMPVCAALSKTPEILKTPDDIRHCSFIFHEYQGEVHKEDSLKTIQAYPMDMVTPITDIPYDLIHLDLEGMEYQVLQGGQEMLKRDRPVVVFETHFQLDPNLKATIQMFQQMNYDVYCIQEKLLNCREDCRNCIAVPRERNEKFQRIRQAFHVLGIPIPIFEKA